MIGVLLLVVVGCFTQNIHANQPVTVTTKYGDVLGYQTNLARIFYGIPFAESPVDQLRYIFLSETYNLFICMHVSIVKMGTSYTC